MASKDLKADAMIMSPKTAAKLKLGDQSPEMAATKDRGEGLFNMIRTLSEVYGWQLLAVLAFGQWLIKGVVWGFSLSALEFLFRDYGVNGPKLQVYKAIVMLPWAMKPLFGIISDALPIFGYRKAPYILMATAAATCAFAAVGFSPVGSIPIQLVVACLMVGCTQASVCDLLTEATYAERIREHPEHGPSLISFVWGGITCGTLVATASVGFVVEHLGASWVYIIVVVPASLMVIPLLMGWLQEQRLTPADVAKHRAKLWEQREVLFLVFAMGFATLLLIAVGLLQDSIWVNLSVALGCALVVVTSFAMLLKPIIGKMNCFFFIQTCCVIDISGASFYFFTNDAQQYPHGPHFSKIFYASGLGVFISLLNLCGMWIYNQYMRSWRYHGLFVFANLLMCGTSLLGLLVYTRYNLVLGLPDTFFVMGTMGAWAIVHMWMWIPGVVLLSHLCPQGVEATMYALLAGCHNLGLSTASYVGACILVTLEVTPQGATDEGAAFENLWIAALIQALAPTLTLILLPWMIPNALQTDSLLEPGSNAVDGSPWQRLMGKRETSTAAPLQQPLPIATSGRSSSSA